MDGRSDNRWNNPLHTNLSVSGAYFSGSFPFVVEQNWHVPILCTHSSTNRNFQICFAFGHKSQNESILQRNNQMRRCSKRDVVLDHKPSEGYKVSVV